MKFRLRKQPTIPEYVKEFQAVPRVLVVMPSAGTVRAETVMWMVYNATVRPNTYFFVCSEGRPVDHNRNRGVIEFLRRENAWDWILFLDSDIIPPSAAIDGLLRSGKKVVSAVCYTQVSNPNRPVGIRISAAHWDGEPGHSGLRFINTIPNSLTEIDMCGGACVLVHKDVIKAVMEKFGCCFQARYEKGLWAIGEDVDFCLKVKECGYKIYLDPTVRCSHMKTVDLYLINKYVWRNAILSKEVVQEVFKNDPEMAKSMYERIHELQSGVYDESPDWQEDFVETKRVVARALDG